MPGSWIERLNTVKMVILLKVIYRFNVIPIKIPMVSSGETEKPIREFIWNFKGPQIDKIILKKKGNISGLTLHDFKTYYKTTTIKTMCMDGWGLQCGTGIRIEMTNRRE